MAIDRIEVSPDDDGLRVDQFLGHHFSEVSRSRWTKLIAAGCVRVNGKAVAVSKRLKAGDAVEVELPPVEDPTASNDFEGPEPQVLFEDSDLIVLVKPRGLTVHPGAGVQLRETLAGWLRATGRLSPEFALPPPESSEDDEDSPELRGGIVHRLDKITSGLLVAAKTPFAQALLSAQFAERRAGRLYWALVAGHPGQLRGKRSVKLEKLLTTVPPAAALRIRALEGDGEAISFASRLRRDPVHRTRFQVSPGAEGRRAVTHFSVISESADLALIECRLETGRTHQIRVHLSALGYPILGDVLYGGAEDRRVWLHAHTLRFYHPREGDERVFRAPLPAEDESDLTSRGLRTETRGLEWPGWNSDSPKDGPED